VPFTRWCIGLISIAVLGACHEATGTSSLAPLGSAEPEPRASVAASVRAPDSAPPHSGSGSDAGPPAPPSALAADAGAVPLASRDAGSDAHITPTVDGSALVDADGKPLPQTRDRPTTSSPAFQQRIRAVAEAIISGDAEPALNAFFPLLAYAQVKDVVKPERDYKFRLVANFKRDVLEYHRALGRDAARAEFSGITVPEDKAKWMEPGSEGNKLGYFRVLRSRLHFTLPTGRTRDFELTSLISWRGEWYVVHLHGFE
jgi:hypothetical protein